MAGAKYFFLLIIRNTTGYQTSKCHDVENCFRTIAQKIQFCYSNSSIDKKNCNV
jgi:hypothetical protein